MIPRKWPAPAEAQFRRVDKAEPGGWITLYFWPHGEGFHYVFHAVSADSFAIEEASSEPFRPTLF